MSATNQAAAAQALMPSARDNLGNITVSKWVANRLKVFLIKSIYK